MATPSNPQAAALAAAIAKLGRYAFALGIGGSLAQSSLYTGELFETDEVDAILQDRNIAVDMASIQQRWHQSITQVLKEATLKMPADEHMQSGSQQGIHTEYLGHILTEMQYLQRAYPEATW